MTDASPRRYLESALAAALEAGPIALEYFRRPMRVDDKLPGVFFDPVTEADRRIETRIRARLGAQFPSHRIVGEEHGDTGDGSTYWVIDPIDGTRSFISGMPTWGILLGLVEDGAAIVGLMHQPFTDETFLADPVDGARYRRNGSEVRLRTRADATLADAILYSTHPAMLEHAGMLRQYQALAARCRLQRWGGDCYAFALLAQGCIDVMVDSMLMPYDIVPLIPIIEGAGGVVTDLDGKSPLQGGTVIAAANARLHAQTLEIMTRSSAES
ncbi:MAG TPA: inositol monophosphatase family protein [Steroidobacteraceae bacterium]